MSSDPKSWLIKEEAVLADLLALINLTAEQQQILQSFHSEAEQVAPELAEAFYARLTAQPHMMEYLEGRVDHLKQTLQQWFTELFSGQYDETYVKDRLRIGKTHVQVGLPIRYPLAMIDLVVQYGIQVFEGAPNSEQAAEAFKKVVSLDIAIFSHAYEESQLNHLTEAVGNERLARRMLMG